MFDFHAAMAFAAHDIEWSLLAFFIGSGIGSFINVVVYRLPIMYHRALDNAVATWRREPLPHTDKFNLAFPRCRCDGCGCRLSALLMVPVISYIVLRGRCRQCGHRIGIRVFLVELVLGLLSAAIVWRTGMSLLGIASLVFLYGGAALALVDAEIQELPDPILYVMIFAGLVFNLLGLFTSYANALISLIVFYLFGWGCRQIIRLTYSHEESEKRQGYGDFKMLAMLGAWFGYYACYVLGAAFIAASIYCLTHTKYLGTKMMGRGVSVGPFFVTAGAGYLFLKLFGFLL